MTNGSTGAVEIGNLFPELLAPAGDWDCARAAVENGADAIYFGLDCHNARLRAHNFTLVELPKLMEFLHRRGVRGYVTFNTLVSTDELAAVARTLHDIIAAGVDALIVQDVGICRLIRALSPDVPIHGSTQMTVSSAAGIRLARELGCAMITLARECSLKDIGEIARTLASFQPDPVPPAGPAQLPTDSASGIRGTAIPLEVFVHGALCFCYSGQCLASFSLGGRSANRGVCAQPCRMPYDLLCDGQPLPLDERRYLLSPTDLCGLELLPDLVRADVHTLKIEGRLKSPEYVASVTRIYREALDALRTGGTSQPDAAALGSRTGAQPHNPQATTSNPRYELDMAFSRGLTAGWLPGRNHQQFIHAEFGKNRGSYLGQVLRVQGDRVIVRLEGPLKAGDGVVFDAGRPDQPEQGGRVYEVLNQRPPDRTGAGEAVLTFGRGDLEFAQIRSGDRVWKTNDPELEKRVRQSYAGEKPHFRRPLDIAVTGTPGQPLTLTAADEQGHRVELASVLPLEIAEKHPLSTERLREQLGRLGGTPFRLGNLRNGLSANVILPVSELNRLRREVVSRLEALRAAPKHWQLDLRGFELVKCTRDLAQHPSPPPPAAVQLAILVRNLPQLDAALHCGVQTIYGEFGDLKNYPEAVRRFRLSYTPANDRQAARSPAPLRSPAAIFLAPPRIFKPGEEGILKQIQAAEPDGILVRNYDHLVFFAGYRRIGDFTLNVANPLAAEYFIQRHHLNHICPAADLTPEQLECLLRAAPPEWFEIILHQHLPMFHTEYCLFCRHLSRGTDASNCGRPCLRHDLKLRDRQGAEHPLRVDAACRNTVYHARPRSAAAVGRLRELGVRRFRLEFLDETPEQVEQSIGQYLNLLG